MVFIYTFSRTLVFICYIFIMNQLRLLISWYNFLIRLNLFKKKLKHIINTFNDWCLDFYNRMNLSILSLTFYWGKTYCIGRKDSLIQGTQKKTLKSLILKSLWIPSFNATIGSTWNLLNVLAITLVIKRKLVDRESIAVEAGWRVWC